VPHAGKRRSGVFRMTTITHTAVGGMLGSFGLGSPASFLLGIASHFPLDLIPHWDIKRPWIDTLLTLGGLGLLLLLFGSSPVFWGAAGGALPDLEHILPIGRKLVPCHGATHGRSLGLRHAGVQVGVLLACSVVIALFAAVGR